jgi:plastocyanin
MNRRVILAIAAACSLAVAFPLRGTAKDKDKDDVDANVVVQHDAVVQFGQGQPQGSPAAVTHFLDPDDVTVDEGGTVTFVVNGGGHGVALYRVDKKTTRADIAADLCQGPPGTAENDRAARATVCNAAAGTANKAYQLTDADGDVVVEVPANVANNNPRVDDQDRTLLGTSGRIPGNPASNPARSSRGQRPQCHLQHQGLPSGTASSIDS